MTEFHYGFIVGTVCYMVVSIVITMIKEIIND